MRILGIHDGHNATAALMVDGAIVAAISEERLAHRKNEMGFPALAAKECLRLGGVTPDELDVVAFSTRSYGNLNLLKIKRECTFTVRDWLDEQERRWKPKFLEGREDAEEDYYRWLVQDPRCRQPQAYDLDDLPLVQSAEQSERMLDRIRKRYLATEFGIPEHKVAVLDHHTCHRHYAYFASPFRRSPCLIFTNDGGGDGANGTVAIAENDNIREVNRNNHSDLGRVYRYITLLLGMKIGEHEFKVMGLAPYASDYEVERCGAVFRELFRIEDGMIAYKNRPRDLFFHFRDRLAHCRFDGIAAAVQEMVERIGTTWVEHNVRQHDIHRVVFSGGTSLNVKLNKCITELAGVEEFYCPASGGDESTALGACYAIQAERRDPSACRPARDVFLGPAFSRNAVCQALTQADLDGPFEVRENVTHADTASLLARGVIIGRLSGRMEFGARALGNRSILANPSIPDTVRRINRQIKFRDFWMPFAPSVMDTHAATYLVNPKRTLSDHMTLCFDTTEQGRRDLAAALHSADFTARAHIVSREVNPSYFDLIRQFERLTGIGAVLNTSFNLHGEPMVCSPEHAIHTFLNSDLDAIQMEDVLVTRKRG